MRDGDILLAISSSGKSMNILNAAEYVMSRKNNPVITFSGFTRGNPLMKSGNYNLYIDAEDYGLVESAHAYFIHMLIDFFIQDNK